MWGGGREGIGGRRLLSLADDGFLCPAVCCLHCQPMCGFSFYHEGLQTSSGLTAALRFTVKASDRGGHLRYSKIFSIIKNDFCIFCQVNLTGSGLFK